MHVCFYFLTNWALSKLCADQNRCYVFDRSENLWCLLHNPVALPYTFLPTYSTPTTLLWAIVFFQSGVHVRSGYSGSIVSSLGVSSGGGARGPLWIGRLVLVHLVNGYSVAPTKVNILCLRSIPSCLWYNPLRYNSFIHRYWVILLIVGLILVLLEWNLIAQWSLYVFPVSVGHIREVVSVPIFGQILMMLQGVIQNLRGYWFDSKLTLIMISLPQPHRTPQNVGEG